MTHSVDRVTATLRTLEPRTAVVPVAAPTALRTVIGGPTPTTWTVIARRSKAVLLRSSSGPDLLSLTGSTGSRTPQSLTLPSGTPLPTTDTVVIGTGLDTTHRVVRWWDSAVPRIHPGPVPAVPAEGGLPKRQHREVSAALRDGRLPVVAAALTAVIGLGPGSTPSGDDIAAGVLAGLYATGRAADAAELFDELGDLDRRTTALSAELLRRAADGHACAEILELLRALDRRSDPAGVAPALRRVLALGATSGADLLVGLLPALENLHPPHTVRS